MLLIHNNFVCAYLITIPKILLVWSTIFKQPINKRAMLKHVWSNQLQLRSSGFSQNVTVNARFVIHGQLVCVWNNANVVVISSSRIQRLKTFTKGCSVFGYHTCITFPCTEEKNWQEQYLPVYWLEIAYYHISIMMNIVDVCKSTGGKIWHRKPTPSSDDG